ncbi:MAG TPA: dihydrofolate reductase family protein [Polyangiaceae bacterium]
MRKLLVFNQVSLDGYIADARGDMSWAHKDDEEWRAFVSNNASGEGELLFGRVTYQQMASFWPTAIAIQSMPIVAKRMNEATKVVFSRTLGEATWHNTQLVKTDLVGTVRQLKSQPGPGLVLMGSGSVVSQLAEQGLVDEYQLVVNPIVLGTGKSMFDGVKTGFGLRLNDTRRFKNGNVVLSYSLAR